jgi:hypothetical protein
MVMTVRLIAVFLQRSKYFTRSGKMVGVLPLRAAPTCSFNWSRKQVGVMGYR